MTEQSIQPNKAAIVQEFRGEFRFLSNFYPAEVTLDGATYPTVEHAFQAAKSNDLLVRRSIRNTQRPGSAKRLGSTVYLRPHWEEIKLGIMEQLVRQKFSKEPLKSRLLATGDAELIEGNYWNDKFWGVCYGEGENHLGQILMTVREELRLCGKT